MENIKECCICREGYNEGNHRPLILPCGHTLCKACVNNVATEHQRTVIQCPICRKNHTINCDELATNYVVIDLLRGSGNLGQSSERPVPEMENNEYKDSQSKKSNNENEEKDSNPPKTNGMSKAKMIGLGVGTVAGGAAAVLAAPVVLTGVGFTSAGIAAGSWAAGMMSAAAASGGGGVAAGSMVALLQSAGAVGLGASATAGVAGAGAGVGAGVTYGFSRFFRRNPENTNSDSNQGEDGDKDGKEDKDDKSKNSKEYEDNDKKK
ncbi:unnamed protein product [Meganyctiphanes norvegica]|uniref:RING-type domain-containing protein n=1 Tax=Meganyctiphanes norvegica TaxID=48144 RepID=A0AAV2R0U4_MEGNR